MRCYVIGGGPSLKQLTYLDYRDMLESKVVLCNQAFKLFGEDLWQPYLVYLDPIMETMLNNKTTLWKSRYQVLSHHYNNTKYKLESNSPIIGTLGQSNVGFGWDKDIIYDGGNAGYLGLGLASHLDDVTEIVLVGFDISNKNAISGLENYSGSDRASAEGIHNKKVKDMDNLISLIKLNKPYIQIINLRGSHELNCHTISNLNQEIKI